ncbi:MAG TPA: dTDP-4-dehydrorhamnose reductase, partial [Methylomirabilota bacterium]|nr:dTDP-4-dehydrorhamnose reductase [Methylomirabilota bacterium]
EQVRAALEGTRPALVFHCAAYTDVDGAEADPASAMRVNGEGTAHVAAACRAAGLGLVYISTDYVFDGRSRTPYREEDPVNPVNAYGRSKWAGEEAVRAAGLERAWIIRSAWLYGSGGKSFVRTILDRAGQGQALRVVNDQEGSPTYTVDLAAALCRIPEGVPPGTYHVTNAGRTTWFAFARAILDKAGMPDVAVEPIPTAASGRRAARPASSVLATGKWAAATGAPLRPWPAALDAFLSTLALSGRRR